MLTIRLEFESRVPIYTQIVDQVRLGIAAGQLQPGDRLEPVRDLARRLGINANTARQTGQLALQLLHRAQPSSKRDKKLPDENLSPEEAGKLFATTKPKLAVYTHLVLSGLPAKGIPFPTHEELLAATRKTYSGQVLVGKDLMSFKIDDTGVSVIEPPRR